MNKRIFTVGFVFTLIVGMYFGWWAHAYKTNTQQKERVGLPQNATSSSEGKFYVEGLGTFSFSYSLRPGAIWLAQDSSYYYSIAGIPTDAHGLVVSYKPTVTPSLEVRIGESTTTDFEIMSYIDAKYPPVSSGEIQYRTNLTPFESLDHQFFGYFVKYEVDGMAGYSAEALVLKLKKGCNSPNSSDCAYNTYTIDNVSGMYTSDEFHKIAESIVRVP